MLSAIGIIGGGMIGASMACLFAGNGVRVTLVEQPGFTAKAEKNCRSIYEDLQARALATPRQASCALARIRFSESYADLSEMEFIFECVFERTPVKHAAYAQIEANCPKVRAVASSTSAISADELAAGFSSPEMQSRLVVAHPWNPPHLAPCVEIVKSQCVREEAVALTCEMLTAMGKKVVVLQKNIPGFIGNRLQYAMLREAIRIVEEGAATPAMVDETLKYSFAPRYTEIGIFEHFDNCGLDLTSDICNYLFPDLCDAKETQPSVAEHVARGELGIKSGRGNYDWSGVDLNAFRERAAAPYYRFFDWSLPVDD